MKKLFHWEMFGVFFIYVLGTVLHYFGDVVQLGTWLYWVHPVNESCFEHAKMAFYPLILWSIIEKSNVDLSWKQILPARALELVVFFLFHQMLFIQIYFGLKIEQFGLVIEVVYSILMFLVGIFLGQYLAYRVMLFRPTRYLPLIVASFFILLYAFFIIYFTYHPLELLLFYDPVNDLYGIP